LVAIECAENGSKSHADDALGARAAIDADAFAVLYERFGRRIHRYIRVRVRDEAVAEDLTAQTFYRALASADTYRGEGSYAAWLYRIAKNTISTWRARRASNVEMSLPFLPDGVDEDSSPLTAALAGEERAALREIVDELPDAQREVVRLRYWKDLSIDEIADATRRSSTAVRQLLHRAKRRMKDRVSAKDLTILLGATGASALAAYSYKRLKKGDG
jgi:RNA polymerase sigma-70 factor (ECF subfamily)